MWIAVVAVTVIALGLAIGWFGLRQIAVVPRLVRSEIQDPSTVSDSDGFVVCRGTAAAGEETFAAPFTGRNCLGFEFEVTERQLSWIGHPWSNEHLDDGVATTAFKLDGAYGTVAVDPSSRRFSLDTASTVTSVGKNETPSDRIQRFLDVRGIKPVARWLAVLPFFGTRQFTERRVDPGREYLIAGRAERHKGVVTLTGDLVITDHSPLKLAGTRLWGATPALIVATVCVSGGLWFLLAMGV